MNVKEIAGPTTYGTLPHYIGTAVGLTAATIWIIIAFQSQYLLPPSYSFPMRLAWPILLPMKWLGWTKLETEDETFRKKQGSLGEECLDEGLYGGHNHANDKHGLSMEENVMSVRALS